ncbi:MAG: HAMP domain-containing histidine kinase [Goleter apudmare HA4340-LM2]|jgi:signal transduction histidine kinase|nr:HAMP domain-containing histidine kinase [Goleter apudmare HA4340-LM2]
MLFISLILKIYDRLNRKDRLLIPLHASSWILLFLISVQQGFSIWIQIAYKETVDGKTLSLSIHKEAQNLLNALIDEAINHRNKPDNNQKITFINTLNNIHDLVQNNTIEVQHINLIKDTYYIWKNHYQNQTLLASTNTEYALAQENTFDLLRFQIQKMLQEKEKLLVTHRNHLQHLQTLNNIVNTLVSTFILLGVLLNLYFLRQRVELPLRDLIKIGQLWQVGQLEAQLGYKSRDEIGRLTEILNEMASKINQRQQSLKARNQRLEYLISALSHDLRTPLLATRNTLDCTIKGVFGEVNSSLKEVLQEHQQANDDLLKFVDTLLDISRYEANDKTHNPLMCDRLNWETVFMKVIALIKATFQKDLDFTYKISSSLPVIYGNRLEIQRVLQNLLDNAARVSQPKQEISLNVVAIGDTQVKISVSDHGPGIRPLEKAKLFHRFIQGRNRYRGKSGLGLYLCRQIVEAHGGSIGVDSILGQGSTFWFTLPVAQIR